jgi:SPP1 gp7 family putative phage head morphogenesis protein
MKQTFAERIASTRDRRRVATRFARPRVAEVEYGRKLRGVAKQVGSIVQAFAPDGVVDDQNALAQTLDRYAALLRPWARQVALSMLRDVERRDTSAWAEYGKEMGKLLRKEIESAPVGGIYRGLLDEQVTLITSIPTEAAERVHRLTTESLIDSSRASEIAKEIARTSEVAASRATLIARTEAARSSTLLTRARAQHIGSPGYFWRTAHDGDVRASHKAMDGKFVAWGNPPTFVEGVQKKTSHTYHAGCFPNCRCWCDPVLP